MTSESISTRKASVVELNENYQTERLLYLVFFLAGAPALVYQVVWQRALGLYFGVDIYSTTVTVSVFMIGLGVGSVLGGWIADRATRLAVTYAVIEILIGLIGLLSLSTMSTVGELFAGSHLLVLIAINSALLFIPTVLMGMTLPIMIKLLANRDIAIGQVISRLYGVNTLGAALGALVSTYLLMGLLGFEGSVRTAAALNIALGVVVLIFDHLAASKNPGPQTNNQFNSKEQQTDNPQSLTRNSSRPSNGTTNTARPNAILLFAFLSGFIALGFEIVLYRVIGIILHSTVYVFGTHLFVFLTGIAVGSLVAEKRITKNNNLAQFGISQILLAALTCILFISLAGLTYMPGIKHLLAASFYTYFHPSIELVSGEITPVSLYSLLDIFFWTALLVFPFAFLMGYGFPNLLAEGGQRFSSLGKSIGSMYFANILGSALGGIATGFLFLSAVGTEGTLRILAIAASVSGIIAWYIAIRSSVINTKLQHVSTPSGHAITRSRLFVPIATLMVVTTTVLFFPERSSIIKALHLADFPSVQFTAIEDKTGVLALRTQSDIIAFKQEKKLLDIERLYIDGSTHGFTTGANVGIDHETSLALSASSSPRHVLSIGLGDGRMAAAAAIDPRVETLVIVELKQSLQALLEPTRQGKVLSKASDKITHIVDDGRRWLLANPDEMFDAIIMFPLHAAHANSGSLFSKEFFSILSKHLNPNGIVFFKNADYYSTPATFASEFSTIIRIKRESYLGSNGPVVLDTSLLSQSRDTVLAQLTASDEQIRSSTSGVSLNRDYRPNTEFYLTYPWRRFMSARASPPYTSDAESMKQYLK